MTALLEPIIRAAPSRVPLALKPARGETFTGHAPPDRTAQEEQDIGASYLVKTTPSARRGALAHVIALVVALAALAVLSYALPQVLFGDTYVRVRGSPTARLLLYSGEALAFAAVLFVLARLAVKLISQRIRLELEREGARSEFRKIFERSPYGCSLVDLATGRFLMINRAELDMFRLEESDVIGKTAEEIGVALIEPDVSRIKEEVMEKGGLGPMDIRIRRPDGETRSVMQSIVLFDRPQGKAFLNISIDVTEQRALEARLSQFNRLDSIGRFAGGIAHDFNNILAAIIGNAELALSAPDEGGGTAPRLRSILEAARKASELTGQLLAFGRMQAAAPHRIEANAAVSGILQMIGRLIGEDISIEWSPGDGVWPIEADPVQVDQIVMNLCLNARDALEGSGRIVVETANAAVSAEDAASKAGAEPGDFVRVSVSDTGKGMSPETLSKIFEPFFTTKPPGKGTGLGLATVYGIVKQCRGWIEVKSALGEGTRFDVHLPRHRMPEGE